MANGLGTITSVTISPSPYWNPDNDKQFTIRWTASNASDNEITGYFLFLKGRNSEYDTWKWLAWGNAGLKIDTSATSYTYTVSSGYGSGYNYISADVSTINRYTAPGSYGGNVNVSDHVKSNTITKYTPPTPPTLTFNNVKSGGTYKSVNITLSGGVISSVDSLKNYRIKAWSCSTPNGTY